MAEERIGGLHIIRSEMVRYDRPRADPVLLDQKRVRPQRDPALISGRGSGERLCYQVDIGPESGAPQQERPQPTRQEQQADSQRDQRHGPGLTPGSHGSGRRDLG